MKSANNCKLNVLKLAIRFLLPDMNNGFLIFNTYIHINMIVQCSIYAIKVTIPGGI